MGTDISKLDQNRRSTSDKQRADANQRVQKPADIAAAIFESRDIDLRTSFGVPKSFRGDPLVWKEAKEHADRTLAELPEKMAELARSGKRVYSLGGWGLGVVPINILGEMTLLATGRAPSAWLTDVYLKLVVQGAREMGFRAQIRQSSGQLPELQIALP